MTIHWSPTLRPKSGQESRREELGSQIYLWKSDASSYASKVIISAHGGVRRRAAKVRLEFGEYVYFYSTSGEGAPGRALGDATYDGLESDGPYRTEVLNYELSDRPGITSVAQASRLCGRPHRRDACATSLEVILGRVLSKWQGYHRGASARGEGETYAGIQDLQDTRVQRYTELAQARRAAYQILSDPNRSGMHNAARAGLDASRGAANGQPPKFDVVTIRNRWWSSTVSMSEVLQQLRNKPGNPSHRYREFHCAFCRVWI